MRFKHPFPRHSRSPLPATKFFRRYYLIALILIGPKPGEIPSLDQRKTIRILTESLLDKIHDIEGDGQTVY